MANGSTFLQLLPLAQLLFLAIALRLSGGISRMAVVAANRVQVAAQAVRVGQARPEAERVEPTMELIRDGDVVRAMEITCSCGEHIIVRCDYE